MNDVRASPCDRRPIRRHKRLFKHGFGGAALLLLAMIPSCMKPISGPGTASKSSNGSTGASSPSTLNASTATKSSDGLRVGSESITAADLWRFERDKLMEATRPMDAQALRNHIEQESARLIRDALTERLLYRKAAERITPQMEKHVGGYVDAEIRKTVTEEFGGVQRRYERDLQTKGLTLDQMRDRMRREIIIASYLDAEIKPKIVEPSRADLFAAYEAYQRENDRPERRRMSLIDVRVMNRLSEDVVSPTDAQWEDAEKAARERIAAARLALDQGASFADVARQYSDGLHTDEGGAWGWVRRGSVRERFEPAIDALYRLEQGAVSDVIETDGGFSLVRCDEIDNGGTPDFVTLQPELKERYYRNMFNDLVAKLVEDLRTKARLEPEALDRLWQATVREGLRIVQDAANGPPSP